METAGKLVDDEELRDLMKENGIGRPSTRANIIETLFRRKYIRKERKRLVATQTGIDLIDSIENELLKSAELTGQWERKLRQIESGELDVREFMFELKKMVYDVIIQVKQSPKKQIAIIDEEAEKKVQAKEKAEKKAQTEEEIKDLVCPKCGNGRLLKGKSAYGCSEWKNGCRFTIPFSVFGKKLTDKQISSLASKGKTGLIKGFVHDIEKISGKLVFDEAKNIQLETEFKADTTCPKCNVGKILKGKTAWGCSNFKGGCNYRVGFIISI